MSDLDTGVVDGLKVLDPDGRLEKRLLAVAAGHPLIRSPRRRLASKVAGSRLLTSLKRGHGAEVGDNCLKVGIGHFGIVSSSRVG